MIRWGQHYGAYNSEAYVATSADAGITWSVPTVTSIPSSGDNSSGDVCISGTRAVAMWIQNPPVQPYYSRSLDGGQTWEDATLINLSDISHFDVPRCAATGSRVYITGYSTDVGHDIWLFRGKDPIVVSMYDDFEDNSINTSLWATGTYGDCGGIMEVDEIGGKMVLHATCPTPDKNNQAILTGQENFYTLDYDAIEIEASLSQNQGYNRDKVYIHFTSNPTPHYSTSTTAENVLIKVYENDGFTDERLRVEFDKEARTVTFTDRGGSVLSDLSSLGDNWYFSFHAHGRDGYSSQGGGDVTLSLNWIEAEGVGSQPPDPVAVSVPELQATYEQMLSIPVEVDDTTNENIVSAEVFLAYDGDLLTAVSTGASNTLLTPDWSIETNIVQGIGTSIDTIKMAMATDDDVLSGAGTLINVLFQMADIRHPAFSPLTLTHVLFNDGTPDYTKADGSVTLVGTDGIITSLPSEILPRWSVGVSVYDVDENRDTGTPDAFAVSIANGSQTETLTVTETGNSTGAFSGLISTAFSLSFSSDDGIIQAKVGDQIVFSYADSLDSNGDTQPRTDITDVLGGTDGAIRATVVSQPGDTVRVRVIDADLSDAVAVSVANPRTGETESILLSQFTSGESHFYGRFFTAAQAGAVGDSTLELAKGDVLSITYADTLTANGGTAAVVDDDEVVDLFGDAHPNGSVQAFDAAQVLIHRLSTYGGGAGTLSGLDSLSANLDQGAPFGIIDGYDASLILRKVVGLISRFEVQEPDAVNHPQPETELRPKPVPEERELALVPGEGYVSVWCEDRGEIVSGELTLAGVQGQVVMGEELQAFLTVSQATEDGLQVVFAGAEAVSGPGELMRIAGVGPGDARLTQVSFNGGRIGARWEEGAASVAVPASFALYPNVPNPFNPETVIRFALAQESIVRLEVFDVVGQRVRVLVVEQRSAGAHQALWDGLSESGERVSSGVYFCRLQAQHAGGEFSQVRRMLLLK